MVSPPPCLKFQPQIALNPLLLISASITRNLRDLVCVFIYLFFPVFHLVSKYDSHLWTIQEMECIEGDEKKGISWENFMTRKGNWRFFIFYFFGCGMEIWVFDLCCSSTSFLLSLLVFSILRFFSPLICAIKYFMNLMLLP